MKKVVWIIGASSGLGRAVAEQHAKAGDSIILSSRNFQDLNSLSSDLHIRYGAICHALVLDLNTITSLTEAKAVVGNFGNDMLFPVTCYVLSGMVHDADTGTLASVVLPRVAQVNFLSAALLISAYLELRQEIKLQVVVASSIAASRTRTKNVAYASSKAALEQYCFGLIHAIPEREASLRIYRLGYMDTNMSFGQKLLFRPRPVIEIAARLVKDGGKASGRYYLPGFWRLVIFVLNIVPLSIYRRLKF